MRSPRRVCSRGSSHTEHSAPTNVRSLRALGAVTPIMVPKSSWCREALALDEDFLDQGLCECRPGPLDAVAVAAVAAAVAVGEWEGLSRECVLKILRALASSRRSDARQKS